MAVEEKNNKEDKSKTANWGPMGPEMFEMMKKCCPGEKDFSDCAAMMKNKMGAMANMPCCGPGIGKTKPERRKK